METSKEKTPFSSTFFGAILILVISGVIVAWITLYLQRDPSTMTISVVPSPVPSGAATAEPSIVPTLSSGRPSQSAATDLAIPRTEPQSMPSPPAMAGDLATNDQLAANQGRRDLPALTDQGDKLEVVSIRQDEAVSLRTFRGTASVSFGEVSGVSFATLVVSPVAGPVVREPIYEAGRSFVVRAKSETYLARVVGVSFSSRTLTLQLGME